MVIRYKRSLVGDVVREIATWGRQRNSSAEHWILQTQHITFRLRRIIVYFLASMFWVWLDHKTLRIGCSPSKPKPRKENMMLEETSWCKASKVDYFHSNNWHLSWFLLSSSLLLTPLSPPYRAQPCKKKKKKKIRTGTNRPQQTEA